MFSRMNCREYFIAQEYYLDFVQKPNKFTI